jgi:hypothetical protein
VVNGSFVFQIKFCGKITALLVAANRFHGSPSKKNLQKIIEQFLKQNN